MSTIQILSDLIGGHRAPGAVVALKDLSDGGRTDVHSVGKANSSELFFIGSITKVLTATLILQHVESGDISLDQPVVESLHGFRVEPDEITPRVTIRHLLTHTSGIDCADDFTATGEDDAALERFVEQRVAGSSMLHAPGKHWSYCNAGFSLLGRMVEVLAGQTWDDCVKSRLAEPLGLRLSTIPRLPNKRDVSTGHRFDQPSSQLVEELRVMPRSGGPAGSNVVATAEDLVEFATALIEGRIVSPQLVREMMSAQIGLAIGGQGLGWVLPKPGVASHLGATLGHTAYLGIAGGDRVVAVVANGPGAEVMARAISPELFAERSDTDTVPNPGITTLDSYIGEYRRRDVSQRIERHGETLIAETRYSGAIGEFFGTAPSTELRPVGEGEFESRLLHEDLPVRWHFSEFDADGHPSQLLTSNRLHRRS